MKTFRLVPTLTEALTLILTVMLAVLVMAESATAQTSRYSSTPDPYFGRQVSAELETKDSGIQKYPPTDHRDVHESAPLLWNAPRTFPKPNAPVTSPSATIAPSSIQWNPPSTDVKQLGLETAGGPQSALKPLAPSVSNSIIREQSPSVSMNQFPPASDSFSELLTPLAGAAGQVEIPTAARDDFKIPSEPNERLFQPNRVKPSVGPPKFNDNLKQLAYTPPSAKTSPDAEATDKQDTSQSFEPGKVLALVGGKPIFVGDVLFEINQMIEKFMPTAPPEFKERERQKMIPQILPKFVESKILFMGSLQMLPEGADIEQILEQAGTEFDKKALEKMMTASGLKSAAEFDAQLRGQGSSLRKLRRSWSQDQLTKYFLGQQLNSDAEVTHQEMLDSYRENIETYAKPAKVRWEQVMIRLDRSESQAAAKQTMVELGNQMVYGANLAATAKKSSHGFLASKGGQHDWTTKGALVLKEIDEAIFSLPVGELSDIIETRDGYHILRVLERTDATHTPFLEAQVEIKQGIQESKRKKAFDEHIAKLKREIPVEYFLNESKSSSLKQTTPRTADAGLRDRF